MHKENEFILAIQKVLEPKQILLNEPMKYHTTFKIGGPADYLLLPASLDELTEVLAAVKSYDMPLTILGNGSNVLVLDRGIRGVVIKFDKSFAYLKQKEDSVVAGAGALLKDVSKFAARCGLTGMEFAVGIPGSIGGAVFMNAGAYDGEISHIVSAVTAVSRDGEVKRFERKELDFGYRHSVFQENGDIICEIELSLMSGIHTEIHDKMGDLTQRRESRQPLEMPSAGSTFKRPVGHFAGTLIEQSGLKGFRIGGAQVSPKHAGFVINAGDAKAQDVLDLINEVQRLVYEKHGVKLYPEVRTLGEK
ncbi:UDP-N-acetylmuramate dehydrogenase [Anaerosinus gibii]|uniref:UDP-N-acetylenolpyruvoylglucosamine reductase n=1 Tax=Selenobaculum gibii TaxID=3054208 RepID=A0A9Y2EVT4_9FIRM|nr:UDP-N-acetylmuramate dehydrogenase [Selenobaculum gbiensis]WIW71644.1 UDP-N-acetylmuramate dehydrogenase [Selenobaculum gbiensis]